MASVYAFLISCFVYRDMGPLHVKVDETKNHSLFQRPLTLISVFFHLDTRDALLQAGKLTVTLMFIIANALILKHVLTD